MNSISNNSPSFNGRLNLNGLQKGGKSLGGKSLNKRWENIAKIFEEKTKAFPDDVVTLSQKEGKLRFDVECCENGLGAFDGNGIFSQAGTEKLMQLSDDKVAGKLAKLLKSYQKAFKTEKMFDKFFERQVRFNRHEISNKADEALSTAYLDIRKAEQNYTISRDNVLKHIEEYV